MRTIIRSIWMWFIITTLVFVWLPLLSIIYVFDRNPVRYRTGRWFRRLGASMVRANPAWNVHVLGKEHIDFKKPYVVVSNHQSMVDIPLLCLLPWEMKWVAKIELFKTPIIGWMMKMAGDIPVDRQKRSGSQALLRAKSYLQQNCPVMIFPEGTRSPDGLLLPFTDGAFRLAIKVQVPLLPIVIDGSYTCLQKKSWKFGEPQDIFIRVLQPVDTAGLQAEDTGNLRDTVRRTIEERIEIRPSSAVSDSAGS
jgi:1-acyl-sn-glycerol-3-phosphate acyltransferase